MLRQIATFAFALCLPAIATAVPQTSSSAKALAPAPQTSLPTLSAETKDPYTKALELLVQGKLKEAEAGFKAILNASPKSVNAMLGLAEVAFRQQQWKAGEKFLLDSLRIEPANHHINTSLGRYYTHANNPKLAEKHLLEAIKQAPKGEAPLMDLADLYNGSLQRPQDAITEYSKVLATNPGHAGAYYARGVAQQKLGNKREAMSDYDNSIRLAPDNPIPYEALARLQANGKEFASALKTLDRILSTHPQLARTRILRSEILAASGDTPGAINELETIVKNDQKRLEFRLRLAMAYHASGKLDKALEHYQQAMGPEPESALAYNNAAAILLQQKRTLDKAESWARKAIEQAPDNADFLETAGQVLLARGKSSDALSTFAKARKASPKNAPMLAGIGRALAANGLKAEARDYLESALKISDRFPGADDAKATLAKLKS
ncbi:MAG TPA: tetratricopeptide repeat protein [Rhodocyclaceae bacterium]|nr:tetratricopeptide repeat protein [Rhodocyclaceae bacterium]